MLVSSHARGRHGALGAAQEASAIFRRRAIYEELHPETKAGVAGGLARQGSANEKSAFAESTADAIGKSRRSDEIAAARGEALGDDLAMVTGTSLDKGVELDALAKLPEDERKGLIDRAKAGERVTARKEPKIAAEPRSSELSRTVGAIRVSQLTFRPATFGLVDS